ncbi:hypothetical protein Aple_077450 [Acrocarpospora pleiomorpha]|uniref:Uncharacterized protein n=1 Tax=Acrocarpospora pleiomorpha TaxID=90975 RepID=A0A5M3XVC2_9ACTN|nr:hypothetical protein Aple_077450 [Acrocarpospora pleiomorpha]
MGKKRRPRRSSASELKAETIELCQRGTHSVGQVTKDFDLTNTSLLSVKPDQTQSWSRARYGWSGPQVLRRWSRLRVLCG